MTPKKTLAAVTATLALCPLAGAAVHVPLEVKQCVVFLYGEESDGKRGACTGFLVAITNEKTKKNFVYLITAKHCLQQQKTGPYYPRIFVRLNLRVGGTKEERVSLVEAGLAKNVFTHIDPAVDLAVIPINPNLQQHEVRYLSMDFLPEESEFLELGIGEGTDVFFTGLFLPYQGALRNYPIVRFGRVALMTPEAIEWRKGLRSRMYLIETAAFGGNSGSPSFFYLGSDRKLGQFVVSSPRLLLAGVVTFAFQEKRNLTVSSSEAEPRSIENLGVTGVVPAEFLKQILLSGELKAIRGER